MKATIGPYRNWVGPFQIAEKILFWLDRDEDERVFRFGRWLGGENDDSWLMRLCLWADEKKQRKISIQVDPWDTWNLDHTIALLLVPMLKQLRATNHGAGQVDDEDVPKGLRRSSAPPTQNAWDVDDNYFKRWDWVMGEIIFAFESRVENICLDKKAVQRMNRGLALFGKYYTSLWD